jgi:MoxR-like ATPase
MTDLDGRMTALHAALERVRAEFGTVIVGNRDVLDNLLKALFTGGHVLLEGLPGIGKTLMVKTAARLLNLSFARVQFTPDLMPADILGVNILMEGERGDRQFRFQPGPVFTNVLLADEINRATPRTQSALLQAMEERQVTVFGVTYDLDDIFLTLATQNPIELKGTYPLPEAQLDRFMFKLVIPAPGRAELDAIARMNIAAPAGAPLPQPVLSRDEVRDIRALIRRVPITDAIHRFAAGFVAATSPAAPEAAPAARRYVRYGASPRGLLALLEAARASAVLDGRFNLAWEDLRENYLDCLRHRLILNFEAQVQRVDVDEVLREIFESLRPPA